METKVSPTEAGTTGTIEVYGRNTGTALLLFAAINEIDMEQPEWEKKAIRAAYNFFFVPAAYRPDTVALAEREIEAAWTVFTETGEVCEWVLKSLDSLHRKIGRQVEQARENGTI